MNIGQEAHRGYFWHVWQSFKWMVYDTYKENNAYWYAIIFGLYSLGVMICLIFVSILSPLLCWVVGAKRMKRMRQWFQNLNGTYVGKLAHLNKYKEEVKSAH